MDNVPRVNKCIMVGDTLVGKTTLCIQSPHKKDEIPPTIGVDFFVWGNGRIKFNIWDTSGNRRFKNITNSYYNNMETCLIVFNLNNKASFHSLDVWYDEATKRKINNIVLIGNKSDLPRCVSCTEISNWIIGKLTKIHYIETSYNDPINIFSRVYAALYPIDTTIPKPKRRCDCDICTLS